MMQMLMCNTLTYRLNVADKVQEGNGRVLVHCYAGVSRSATIAIGYVMKHFQMTLDEAYRLVQLLELY